MRSSLAEVIEDLIDDTARAQWHFQIVTAFSPPSRSGRERRPRRERSWNRCERLLPIWCSRVTAGIGRICQIRRLLHRRNPSPRAIALSAALGAVDRVIVFEDLGVYRILVDLPRPSDALKFAEDQLGAGRSLRRRPWHQPAGDLEAYLAANGVLQRTAVAMSVHVNTLTYRLQRIRDLTGVDMNDSDARLGLHLAVKIRQAVRLSIG